MRRSASVDQRGRGKSTRGSTRPNRRRHRREEKENAEGTQRDSVTVSTSAVYALDWISPSDPWGEPRDALRVKFTAHRACHSRCLPPPLLPLPLSLSPRSRHNPLFLGAARSPLARSIDRSIDRSISTIQPLFPVQ